MLRFYLFRSKHSSTGTQGTWQEGCGFDSRSGPFFVWSLSLSGFSRFIQSWRNMAVWCMGNSKLTVWHNNEGAFWIGCHPVFTLWQLGGGPAELQWHSAHKEAGIENWMDRWMESITSGKLKNGDLNLNMSWKPPLRLHIHYVFFLLFQVELGVKWIKKNCWLVTYLRTCQHCTEHFSAMPNTNNCNKKI